MVRLWTHNNLGFSFDHVCDSDNGLATFIITRDLANNTLPESCGDGDQVWPAK